MASTAELVISGTVDGLPEGTDTLNVVLTNSTAVGMTQLVNLTSGVAGGQFVPTPTNARFCLIIPPSTLTSTVYPRLAMNSSGNDGAIALGGPSLVTLATASPTTVFLWSSNVISSTQAGGQSIRVSWY